MHDYYTPERAVKTLRRCEEVGINAWQGHERGTLLGIYNRYRQGRAERCTCWDSRARTRGHQPVRQDRRADRHRPSRRSDRPLFKQGKLDVVHDCLKRIRDAGLLVGVSTHMPDVVDAVESKGWDLDYYQTCVYERHRSEADLQKLLGHVPLPVGEVYPEERSAADVQGDPADQAALPGVQDPCRRAASTRRGAGVSGDVRRDQAQRRRDRRASTTATATRPGRTRP